MAKFVKAPETDDFAAAVPAAAREPGTLERAADWLAAQGIETGLAGGVLLALGAALVLWGLALTVRVVLHHGLGRELDGEVIGAEPAAGGGYDPVIRYVDPSGKARRFLAGFATQEDPTGQRVRLRVIGGSPEIVAPGPDMLSAALGAFAPLALGAAAIMTGLTGALAGILPLPWF